MFILIYRHQIHQSTPNMPSKNKVSPDTTTKVPPQQLIYSAHLANPRLHHQSTPNTPSKAQSWPRKATLTLLHHVIWHPSNSTCYSDRLQKTIPAIFCPCPPLRNITPDYHNHSTTFIHALEKLHTKPNKFDCHHFISPSRIIPHNYPCCPRPIIHYQKTINNDANYPICQHQANPPSHQQHPW